MNSLTFGEIRKEAWKLRTTGLNRKREDGELTDDYTDSLLCEWQASCSDTTGLHCSFYCSLGDWLNNISDELTDARWDSQTQVNHQVLFRFYTRVLKLVSEVVEDFIYLHAKAKDHKKKENASICFSQDHFAEDELKNLSNFINSITKHKSERRNLHVINHHRKVVFEDFGAEPVANQIRLDKQDWDTIDKNTTILMPSLKYLVGVVVRLHQKLALLLSDEKYRNKVYEYYADEFVWEDEDDYIES